MQIKTYTQKSNAVRAQKTVNAKLGNHIAVCDVVGDKEQGFALYIKLNHYVPAELTAYLNKQGHNFVILAEPEDGLVVAPLAGTNTEKQTRVRYANLVWPKAGGKCDQIWQIAQAYYESTGEYPTPKAIRATCEQVSIDTEKSTFTRQLYAWRKYTQASIVAAN